jgi:hypothetical protein
VIHRTLVDAQREPSPFAGWKQKVTAAVTLANGTTFFRTYVFDQSTDKCRRCRKARPGLQGRLACTGHVCEACGNPFAAYCRQMRRQTQTGWQTVRNAWTDNGLLH